MAAFGKSWLTTLVGIVGALLALFSDWQAHGTITTTGITSAATALGLGAAAKSFNAYTPDKEKAIEDQAKTIAYRQQDRPADVDNQGQAIAK